MTEKHVGEVVQVIGPVLDIRFAMMNCLPFSTPLRLIITAPDW